MKTKELFIQDWKFLKTPLGTTFQEAVARKQEFQTVEIPHDWLIYDTKNLYEDSFGWYYKEFSVSLQPEEKIKLYFEGIYMNSTIYVNGIEAFHWKYGYSSFEVDVTEYLKQGSNEIYVCVRHQSPNSRWYSGAGIYRNVYIKHCGKNFLPLNGTYFHTSSTDSIDYICEIETEVEGPIEEGTKLVYSLVNQAGERTLLGEVKPQAAAKRAVLEKKLEGPVCWTLENPYCYTLLVELMTAEGLADCQEITVGFRTMTYDPQQGFFLNGKKTKVHGVCEHHDLGCLGAAVNPVALRRQLEILKGMGVNGIRTSHNMPATELLELADRMGFVVLDEAFDMWERTKTPYDYGNFFKEWAHKDVESWIRRDRNHPCIMMWSIGNEIYDTHADEHGQEITRRLIQYVREHDPKENAVITIGSNYMPWEGAQNCADIVKFAGYNYGEKYYNDHHQKHPDWIIYGSETASVVQSRGIYHFPLSQSILSDEDEQCSALGNSATSWGAKSTVKCITDDRDATYSFGQFLWTGFDYIGEPTPYHTKNSYFGQIDTAGFEKDPYYIFKAEWTDYKQAPFVHLYPYWDFNEGQLIDVCATTNCPRVELIVNGVSQGIQEIDHEHGLELIGTWLVPYAKGYIEAIAYDENGAELARDRRESFQDTAAISLSCKEKSILANGQDIAFITIEAVDEAGKIVENAVDYVTVAVSGPGRLLGMDNGDSTDYDPYKSCTRKLFSGKLLAMIGATNEPGTIQVTVSAREGIAPASLEIEAKECECKKKGMLEAVECIPDEALLQRVPARKVELVAQDTEHSFSADKTEMLVTAHIYPREANNYSLIWKIVNDGGIDVNLCKVELVSSEGNQETVKLTATGDGEFRLRCMLKDETGKVTIISQLEYSVTGLGTCFLNPYELISAGLFTETVGEIGNGNEKGISTQRDGYSGIGFDQIDFGEYGSDEITVPVFALDGGPYTIEIWDGTPGKPGQELLDTVIYQKPTIWNHYQEETWKLPKRLKGIGGVGFALEKKAHIKGFVFTKQEKAYGKLYAAECSRVYGDSFDKQEQYVEAIGNNVTLEFENMDFGEEGAARLMLCGRTPLVGNTIHIHFTPYDGGEQINRMVEFTSKGTGEYEESCFAIEAITGKGRIDFVFLPGSQFDFAYFQFQK